MDKNIQKLFEKEHMSIFSDLRDLRLNDEGNYAIDWVFQTFIFFERGYNSRESDAKMKVIKFLDKTWQEIPELDNPALRCNMIKDRGNFDALIHRECLMIFKGRKESYKITDGGFVVARVPKNGDIIKFGVFWTSEYAELFANSITL